jgi:hypothetical protein
MPEVIRAALVSALTHHGMQPAGREVWEFCQSLPDQRQIGVDHRGAQLRAMPGQSSLRQHATHGRVMQAELARDGAAASLFDVIQAQDPGLQFSGDGHKHAPWSVGVDRGDGLRRRTKSIRTNNGSRLQQRQHRDERDVAVAAGPSRRAGWPPARIEAGGTTSSTSGAGEP